MNIRSWIVCLFAGSLVVEYTPALLMVKASILRGEADFHNWVGVGFLTSFLQGLV